MRGMFQASPSDPPFSPPILINGQVRALNPTQLARVFSRSYHPGGRGGRSGPRPPGFSSSRRSQERRRRTMTIRRITATIPQMIRIITTPSPPAASVAAAGANTPLRATTCATSFCQRLAMPGKTAPAAATASPATNAYSKISWPSSSVTRRATCFPKELITVLPFRVRHFCAESRFDPRKSAIVPDSIKEGSARSIMKHHSRCRSYYSGSPVLIF